MRLLVTWTISACIACSSTQADVPREGRRRAIDASVVVDYQDVASADSDLYMGKYTGVQGLLAGSWEGGEHPEYDHPPPTDPFYRAFRFLEVKHVSAETWFSVRAWRERPDDLLQFDNRYLRELALDTRCQEATDRCLYSESRETVFRNVDLFGFPRRISACPANHAPFPPNTAQGWNDWEEWVRTHVRALPPAMDWSIGGEPECGPRCYQDLEALCEEGWTVFSPAFAGTMEDFVTYYLHTETAIKDLDPMAKVGAPWPGDPLVHYPGTATSVLEHFLETLAPCLLPSPPDYCHGIPPRGPDYIATQDYFFDTLTWDPDGFDRPARTEPIEEAIRNAEYPLWAETDYLPPEGIRIVASNARDSLADEVLSHRALFLVWNIIKHTRAQRYRGWTYFNSTTDVWGSHLGAGLLHWDGEGYRLKPQGLAYKLVSQLRKAGQILVTSPGEASGFEILAARSSAGNLLKLLLVNFTATEMSAPLSLHNFPPHLSVGGDRHVVDESTPLLQGLAVPPPVDAPPLSTSETGNGTLVVHLTPWSVTYLEYRFGA